MAERSSSGFLPEQKPDVQVAALRVSRRAGGKLSVFLFKCGDQLHRRDHRHGGGRSWSADVTRVGLIRESGGHGDGLISGDDQ